MNLSVDVGWQWQSFGFLVGYNKDQRIRTKTIFIQILFISIMIDWGY